MNSDYYYNIGISFCEHHKSNKGLKYFRKSIYLKPTDIGLHYDYALALEESGLMKDSLFEWEYILKSHNK